jgi:hypothetical protein
MASTTACVTSFTSLRSRLTYAGLDWLPFLIYLQVIYRIINTIVK